MSSASSLSKVFSSQGVRRFFPLMNTVFCTRKSSLWAPDYLEMAKSKYPEYKPTNIQIKGFDYVILEKCQKKIIWLAKQMGLNVTDKWPQELQKLKVTRLKPKSSIPECEYILKLYERNVQVSDVYSYQMPLFIDLITRICPPGVKLHVHTHELFHLENRYVPEYKILELQEQIQELETK